MTKTAFLAQAKHAKRSSDLVFFPEGTFDTTVWSAADETFISASALQPTV